MRRTAPATRPRRAAAALAWIVGIVLVALAVPDAAGQHPPAAGTAPGTARPGTTPPSGSRPADETPSTGAR